MVHLITRGGGFVFGVDTEANVAQLPTTPAQMEAITGHEEGIPAWSFALTGNGKVYWFSGTAWALFGEV